jgi:voltage-gated potassium channel
MNGEEARPKRLRDDPAAREELLGRLDRYLDVPLALASLALVLIAIIELTGEAIGPWQGRLAALGWALWSLFFIEFAVKLTLAPAKRRYLREHWLDALIVLLPFLRVLRLAQVVQTARALPAFRLLVFGGRGSQSTLALLKRRRIGQLAIISAMVILIGAALGFLLEAGAPGARIQDFGDALWWSGALVTTVSSEIYPVTAAGRVLGFLLMLYAISIFTYFIGSVSSVLVALDARPAQKPKQDGVELSDDEIEALRSILKKAEGPEN